MQSFRKAAGRCAAPASLLALLLGGCTNYESQYEKGVYDLEPIYCYQTIGAVDCHRQPNARDADRLVNYYGPAPSKYDPPDPPHLNKLRSPPKGRGYWRAPEPIPGPPPEPDEVDDDSDGNSDCRQPPSCPQPEDAAPGSLSPSPSPASPPPAPPPAPPSPSPPAAPPSPSPPAAKPAPAPANTPAAEVPAKT